MEDPPTITGAGETETIVPVVEVLENIEADGLQVLPTSVLSRQVHYGIERLLICHPHMVILLFPFRHKNSRAIYSFQLLFH